MQGLGVETSRANPADSNLFERFAIPNCGGLIDTTTKEVSYLCVPLDDVPKLMTGAASDGSGNFGWAANSAQPGDGQQRILARTLADNQTSRQTLGSLGFSETQGEDGHRHFVLLPDRLPKRPDHENS